MSAADRSNRGRGTGAKYRLPVETIPSPASNPQALAITGDRLALWDDVRSRWNLTSADMSLLRNACEALERASQLSEQVTRDGAVFKDRFGGFKPNPACQLERDFRGLAARVLAQLSARLGD